MGLYQKIYVAGHRGMAGSAVIRALENHGYSNIVCKTSSELDLKNQADVNDFFAEEKPDIVIMAAAKVGGILANDNNPYTFLYENLAIETNVTHAAHMNDVNHMIFLGSSCIYPKMAPQPLKEDDLLTGPLEPTNEWYAVAKIAGLKLCEALRKQHQRSYVSLMPTNLYGPHDNFDLETSHVLPAMIRKFHDALPGETVTLWGSGNPRREFLHADDLAGAILHCIGRSMPYNLYNVGAGKDITIKELALTIQKITGHRGEINWDHTKPDGTPRKLMDTTRMKDIGWTCAIPLKEGIEQTYNWFLENEVRKV